MRFRSILLLLAVCALGALASAAVGLASGTDDHQLIGTVGPDPAISLTRSDGSAVTSLDPGQYTITVNDKSSFHDFHLTGPGVDMATDVSFVGTTTWTVNLVAGSYHFQCDPHAAFMKGDFTVSDSSTSTSTSTSTETTTSAPPPAKAGQLTGTVGPTPKIALVRGGKAVKRLKAGRYLIVVRDRSAAHDFHLIGPGINKKTGVAFVGTVRWSLRLRAGTYSFRCDPHRAFMKGSFRVS